MVDDTNIKQRHERLGRVMLPQKQTKRMWAKMRLNRTSVFSE